MALGLLFLFLTLLRTVQTQGNTAEAESLLVKAFAQKHINYTWEYGKWYSIATADFRNRNGTNTKINMHSIVFNRTADHDYLLTTITYRPFLLSIFHDPKLDCDQWTRKFSRADHPRHLVIEYPNRPAGLEKSIIHTIYAAHEECVLVTIRHKFLDDELFLLTLYGRTKEVRPLLKEQFIYFAKFLGFTEDNIFYFVPIDKCIDDC